MFPESYLLPVFIAEGPGSGAMMRRLKSGTVTSVIAEARQPSMYALRERKPEPQAFSVSSN